MTDTTDERARRILDGLDFDAAAPVLAPAPEASLETNLSDEFWSARPRLAHIKQAAHSRGRSPDAILGVVLARVATATSTTFSLPAIVGAEGSLNVLVAIVSASGGGKTTAKTAACELIPLHDNPAIVDDVPLGSGEGLIESFFEWVETTDDNGNKVKVKAQTKRAVFAYLDEGDALADMGERKGSTLLPTLRNGWSGATLGQANASEDRKRRLGAGTYRLAVVIGFQHKSAARLLDDAAGGTPQRCLWVSGVDPTVPYEAPPWPGRIDWPGEMKWKPGDIRDRRSIDPRAFLDFNQQMGVSAEVITEVRNAAIARTRGEVAVDPLDAHHDLGRLKVAGLLALLDDRPDIDNEDWRLAGMVMDTSVAVRGTVVAYDKAVKAEQERAKTASLSRRQGVLDDDAAGRALARMSKAIANHVRKGKCATPCKRRCMTQSTSGQDRKLATPDDAIDVAVGEGWIVRDGEEYWPGKP